MIHAPRHLLFLLALLPLWAGAQVPHDMTYQGRLTDAVGAPLAGPVDVSFAIHDVLAGGTALYTEDHLAVALDENGAFSIQVGTGTSQVGEINPGLFSGVNRYLEVVVDGEKLSPRQPLSSVPYALVAEDVVVDPTNNIGTVIANAQSTADTASSAAAAAQAAATAAEATADAAVGVGIASVEINSAGVLELTLSNGTVLNAGTVSVPSSPALAQGAWNSAIWGPTPNGGVWQ